MSALPLIAIPLNNQVFQLYDLNKDFTQSDDVAAKNPAKVAEMRKMASDRAASKHHSRSFGVRLHAANDWTAPGRFPAAAEHLLHNHRRH